MTDLSLWQYVLIGLVFVWSGFVRSGLGFGGAVLALPFLLLIHDDPLVFLPLIAAHLLLFSSLTVIMNNRRQPRTTQQQGNAGAKAQDAHTNACAAHASLPSCGQSSHKARTIRSSGLRWAYAMRVRARTTR